MYSEPSVIPPIYIIVIATTVFAVLLGLIFKDMLEYQLALWRFDPDPKSLINYRTNNIRIAYSATSLFVFLCVASSLAVFIPIYWLAIVVGAVVVFPTAFLMWVQLGSMLDMLATKGLEAVDLDLVVQGDPLPPKPKKKSTPKEA
ncbi:MAG: hypothetical protein WBA77_23840 [Microcoleaceae cyanobacterium]